jgi:valyl-tRNA synthetase
VTEAVDAALTAYRFNDAANALYAHIWGVVCDWYVEFSKPLLQGEDEAARAETQATMAWALDQCLILLHPIMPFITEALWGQIAPRDTMLVHAAFPTLSRRLSDPQADADMGWTIALIEGVRSVRAEMNIAPGAQLPLVVVGASEAVQARLPRVDALVRRLARLSSVDHADAAPKGAVTVAVEGATLCLPLAGVIDLKAESARLDKALAKVAKEAAGLQAKLGNEAFLAKAPETVVAEQRARLAALDEETAKLKAAMARLADLG